VDAGKCDETGLTAGASEEESCAKATAARAETKANEVRILKGVFVCWD
jgi:hypothetical protein